jgi:hypothetical protein
MSKHESNTPPSSGTSTSTNPKFEIRDSGGKAVPIQKITEAGVEYLKVDIPDTGEHPAVKP